MQNTVYKKHMKQATKTASRAGLMLRAAVGLFIIGGAAYAASAIIDEPAWNANEAQAAIQVSVEESVLVDAAFSRKLGQLYDPSNPKRQDPIYKVVNEFAGGVTETIYAKTPEGKGFIGYRVHRVYRQGETVEVEWRSHKKADRSTGVMVFYQRPADIVLTYGKNNKTHAHYSSLLVNVGNHGGVVIYPSVFSGDVQTINDLAEHDVLVVARGIVAAEKEFGMPPELVAELKKANNILEYRFFNTHGFSVNMRGEEVLGMAPPAEEITTSVDDPEFRTFAYILLGEKKAENLFRKVERQERRSIIAVVYRDAAPDYDASPGQVYESIEYYEDRGRKEKPIGRRTALQNLGTTASSHTYWLLQKGRKLQLEKTVNDFSGGIGQTPHITLVWNKNKNNQRALSIVRDAFADQERELATFPATDTLYRLLFEKLEDERNIRGDKRDENIMFLENFNGSAEEGYTYDLVFKSSGTTYHFENEQSK